MSNKTRTTATKEETKPALLPKLRFPKFRGEEAWKPVTLQEASTPVTERVGERKLTPVSISAGIGFVPQAEKFGRDISGNQYQLYTLVSDGDFVFNKGNSLKFPQGCVYQLRGWGQVAAPNVFICFRFNNGYSDGFFQQCFEQNQHGRQLKRHITSGARSNGLLNISKETFFGVEVPTPSPAEQQKIAECLSSVDELMAAQARKVDALKTHKRGLMQQLFPREGETQPRLRFPEFQTAGEWKSTRFGALGLDVSDGNYSSKYPSQSDFVVNGVPFLRANNLKFGMVSDDDIRFISKEQHSQITKGHLKQGDILITTRGELGTVALVPDRHIGSNINAQIVRINSGNKLIGDFLFQLLDYSRQIGLFHALSTGTALKQLPIGKLNQLVLQIPERREEQQRIASCLSSLDALITAATQKLEALKTHKKGLMQQLFPSPEAVEA